MNGLQFCEGGLRVRCGLFRLEPRDIRGWRFRFLKRKRTIGNFSFADFIRHMPKNLPRLIQLRSHGDVVGDKFCVPAFCGTGFLVRGISIPKATKRCQYDINPETNLT